ncbi:autotransporter outer membrane beta-barrel domain-containing protein, partial [Escherichia coli]|uniref:autotransporter outer membrane beta-barrel domain-containing protein n=1 Tax=Escherichia coli TaxID=562 RepID=UPI00233FBEE6
KRVFLVILFTSFSGSLVSRIPGAVHYGVGLNARFGDNTRLGLEVERSAFGKYNTDDAINANIRYSF